MRKYPVILDRHKRPSRVLSKAFDILATEELNGEDTLSFKVPYRDEGEFLDNEALIRVNEKDYRIRTRHDTKPETGPAITEVFAESSFYDLTYSVKKNPVVFENETALLPMRYALEDTGWQVGRVEGTETRSFEATETNALALLRTIQELYGGDLIFNNKEKTVSLLYQHGKKSGVLFSYQKNMRSIERLTDSTGLITRLYAYGEDGLTFSAINDGKPYLEDFSYTDEVRVGTLDLASFKNPKDMLRYTKMRLGQYAKPRISYVMKAMDLSVLSGFQHEAFDLGDEVLVLDKDLGLNIKTRVVRMERNLLEPWKNVLELSTKLRELGNRTARREREAQLKDKQNEDRLKALAAVQRQTQSNFVAWRDAQTGLTEIMAHGQGYYSTIREDPSGAITSYIHDRPLLVDSTYIMKRTATGEAWSNDGGQSWNSGRDADGRMLATVLSAIGINAEWINVGGDPLNVALDAIRSNVVYKVDLISMRGSIATSDTWESRLLARVYHGSTDITDEIDAGRFKWARASTRPDLDSLWNQSYAGGRKEIPITYEDARLRSTFTCEIL